MRVPDASGTCRTFRFGNAQILSLGDDEFFKNANPVLRTGLLSLSLSGTSPHRKSRSSVSFTRLGLAFPLEAFMTWPFKKLIAAAFPAR